MQDFPVFTTNNGVASLILSQIPYTQKAYIQIQSSETADLLLDECVSFCTAVGAEHIYASGHPVCAKYPFFTQIWKMQADADSIGETDASIFPMCEKTVAKWREIYNEKVRLVPNGAFLTIQKSQEFLKAGDCYFVHRDGKLLGIGKAAADRIEWIASVEKGAGEDVIRALRRALSAETVWLEVASENKKALLLYEKLGFLKVSVVSQWYQIK